LDLPRRGERSPRHSKSKPSTGLEAHEKEIPVKKTAPKKMTLSRETLGTLNDKDMKAILGGAPPETTDSKNACCV
jgi:hypothetical protein